MTQVQPHVPFFRRRHAEPPAPPRDQRSWLLRNAQNMAHFSQVGLLLLAVFGYFYTVKPIYRFEQLQEDTAKLTQEYDDMKGQLADSRLLVEKERARFRAQQKELIAKQTALKNQLAKERTELLAEQQRFVGKLEAEKRELETQLTQARSRITHAEAETERVRQLARYRAQAQSSCLRTPINISRPDRDSLVACMQNAAVIDSLAKEDADLLLQWIEDRANFASTSMRPINDEIDFAWNALNNIPEIRDACLSRPQDAMPSDAGRRESGFINCADLRAVAEQMAGLMRYYSLMNQAIEVVARAVATRLNPHPFGPGGKTWIIVVDW